jgi:hypothetical protein
VREAANELARSEMSEPIEEGRSVVAFDAGAFGGAVAAVEPVAIEADVKVDTEVAALRPTIHLEVRLDTMSSVLGGAVAPELAVEACGGTAEGAFDPAPDGSGLLAVSPLERRLEDENTASRLLASASLVTTCDGCGEVTTCSGAPPLEDDEEPAALVVAAAASEEPTETRDDRVGDLEIERERTRTGDATVFEDEEEPAVAAVADATEESTETRDDRTGDLEIERRRMCTEDATVAPVGACSSSGAGATYAGRKRVSRERASAVLTVSEPVCERTSGCATAEETWLGRVDRSGAALREGGTPRRSATLIGRSHEISSGATRARARECDAGASTLEARA